MLLKPDDERLKDPRRPRPAPEKFAGKWVAWNKDRTEVIAHGDTVAEVRARLRELEATGAVMEKVPRVDGVYIGRV